MSQHANVRSIAALAEFRVALAKFGDAAKQVIDELDIEVRRMVDWVRIDQPQYWRNQMRAGWDRVAETRNDLEKCQQALFDGQRPTCYQQRKAFEAAKAYVRHCEEKIDIVRRWSGAVMQESAEYESRVSQFRTALESDVPRSLALLGRMLGSLESYTALDASVLRNEEPAVRGSAAVPVSPHDALRDQTPGLVARGDTIAGTDAADDTEASTEEPPAAGSVKAALAKAANREVEQQEVDEAYLRQQAMPLASRLGVAPDFARWDDQVVLAAGSPAKSDVYMERIDAPAGDTGWFLGPVSPSEQTPRYEAMTLLELLGERPALVKACALPPGYLAVFAGDQVTAVLDVRGVDLLNGAVV